MTDYPGYDNPQLTLDPGRRPATTIDFDTSTEHWSLTTGHEPRLDQHGVGHSDPH